MTANTKVSRPKTTELTYGVQEITPAIAEMWLARNMHNRNLRERYVDILAGAIRDGAWQVNGDAIKFDKDNVLLDGQHRLAAVVKADKPIRAFVVWNLDRSAQATLDQHLRRSLADILSLEGVDRARELASAANWLWKYSNGKMVDRRYNLRADQIKQMIESHPGLMESVKVGKELSKTGLRVPPSLASALHYVMDEVDTLMAQLFWDQLITGLELKEADSVYVLRRALEKNAMANRRVQGYVLAAWVIKAWNATRQGKKIKLIAWKAVEPFPTIE
jgi:hypothetical protein